MNTCIFHANCPDGIMSAVVASLANPGIELYPTSDRINPPPPNLIDGKDVLIADFSYPLDVIKDIAARASNIVLLDHHASAEKTLGHLPYCIFDNSKSGAQICWDFFFPGQVQPILLQAVGEADRGLCDLPYTRNIMTMAEVLPFEAEAWLEFALRLENNLESELLNAEAISTWRSAKIDRLLTKSFFTEIAGFVVPAINACDFKSELGRRLAKDNPFAAVFSGYDGKWYISLRSAKEGEDVSRIAESFGGGGHRNAAAFISDKAPRNIEESI